MFFPAFLTVSGRLIAPALCIIAATLSALPAQAGVYRCKDNNGAIIYQETACPGGGEAVRLQTHEPSAADREDAQARTARERIFVDGIDAEREQNTALGHKERQQAQKDRDSQKKRCAGYLAEAERLEKAEKRAMNEKRRKVRDESKTERARKLREQHFSECSRL